MSAILETDLLWPDEAAAQATAERLAGALRPSPDATIELHGPLGAGKTTFVRLLLRALGVQGRIKSPSSAVMERYELPESAGGGSASHFDFDRCGVPREWADAGVRVGVGAPGRKRGEWCHRTGCQARQRDIAALFDHQCAGGQVT